MDFGFTKDQDLLRQSVSDFLAGECSMAFVRQMMGEDLGYSPSLWQKMADLGWTGLMVPEQYQGAGLSMMELVVVLEEMGKVMLPGPFFSTVVLGGLAIEQLGNEEQKKTILPGVAEGRIKLTLAFLEASARWDESGVVMSARRDGGKYILNGLKLFVPDAHVADFIVCAARTDRGIAMFLIDSNTAGIQVRPLQTMDATRKLFELKFEAVEVERAALLGEPGDSDSVARILEKSKVALSGEMCGGARRVLDMTVDYAKMREQFGRPIGSFQAIQHKCADMLIQVENAKSATYFAAWASANDPSQASLAAAMAKAYCSDTYREVTSDGVQVHGGIGFTWEHDLHIYFKRAKASEVAFGDGRWNRELVAGQTLD